MAQLAVRERLDGRSSLSEGGRMTLAAALRDPILADIEARTEQREAFLASLVRAPSSNPPGDCAPIAEFAAELLEELGFHVERHPIPTEVVVAAGMISCTNLVARRRF